MRVFGVFVLLALLADSGLAADSPFALYLIGGNRGWAVRYKGTAQLARWYWDKEYNYGEWPRLYSETCDAIRWKGPTVHDEFAVMEAPQLFPLTNVMKPEDWSDTFDDRKPSRLSWWVWLEILTGSYRGLFHFYVKSAVDVKKCDEVMEYLTNENNANTQFNIEKIAVEWWTFDVDNPLRIHYEDITPVAWALSRELLFAHIEHPLPRFSLRERSLAERPVQCAGVAHTLDKAFYDSWPLNKYLEFRAGEITKKVTLNKPGDTGSQLGEVLLNRGLVVDYFSVSLSLPQIGTKRGSTISKAKKASIRRSSPEESRVFLSRRAVRPHKTIYYLTGYDDDDSAEVMDKFFAYLKSVRKLKTSKAKVISSLA